jgi:hypothetical protein
MKDPVREFLESYWELRRESDRLSRRIEELTCQCENMTAKYGGMPRGGGGGSAAAVWDALIEAKDRVNARLIESLQREAEIEAFIDSIPNKLHRQILRCRYLEGLHWQEIETRVNYYHGHVRRYLHGAALQAARRKWQEREEQKS